MQGKGVEEFLEGYQEFLPSIIRLSIFCQFMMGYQCFGINFYYNYYLHAKGKNLFLC